MTMRHEIVHRRDGCYASFPGLARCADGAVLCVYREAGAATAAAAAAGRPVHQDTDSRIVLRRRPGGADRWSPSETLVEGGEVAPSDPAVTVLRDGRWLVRYARWRIVPSRDRQRLGGPLMRHFVRRGEIGTEAGNGFLVSEDAGATWRALAGTVADAEWAGAPSRDAVVELDDGVLMLPVYRGYPFHAECAAVLRSYDGGETWCDPTPVAGEPWRRLPYRQHTSFNETSVVALDATTLVALVRADAAFVTDGDTFISEGGVGELHWTRSLDVGLTWEPVRTTGLWGQPAHLLAVGGGRLVCTYGHRRRPFGIRAALCEVSNSGFRTVAHIVLRDDAAGWDCGYPSSVLVGEGTILSAYYLHGEDGVRHVAATEWRLDEMTPVSR